MREIAPLRSGQKIAPGYTVIAHLNRGRRLDVYDVWSSKLDARCVAKTIRPERGREGPARRALIIEGRLLRRFAHPHIVRAYDVVEASEDGRPVVILETLAGETLAHLLDRVEVAGRWVKPLEAAVMARQLCSALQYLHAHRLLHLDLKPGNVVVESGRARLIDLSIARPPGVIRHARGTYHYMAPEQTKAGPVSEAADVWGLGIVLFETLTFRTPFEDPDADDGPNATDEPLGEETPTPGSDAHGDHYPQVDQQAPSVRRFRRVPRKLADLIDACLARDPAQRPSMPEIAAELDALPGIGIAIRPHP